MKNGKRKSNEGFWQCDNCGCIDLKYKVVTDRLYELMYCPHCRAETNYLWIGKYPDEMYIYYDVNKDSRYYEYKTKQND